jgi:imidazole glycerol-phosphate synthase subunit HisF
MSTAHVRRIRVIPCLLIQERALVKTIRFKDPRYVGDPINAVRIFNEKEVDELILLDISATKQSKPPDLRLIEEIAGECFMPLCYGGGVSTLDDVTKILSVGVEKVAVNTRAMAKASFVREIAEAVGSQSIAVSIDAVRKANGEYEVRTESGSRGTGMDPVTCARQMEEMGAGELIVNSIDRDGTMAGYELDLIGRVARAVSIPVIACGGAGRTHDFSDAVRIAGASAVAAGSLFVFYGRHRAVLINYPSPAELEAAFAEAEPRGR